MAVTERVDPLQIFGRRLRGAALTGRPEARRQRDVAVGRDLLAEVAQLVDAARPFHEQGEGVERERAPERLVVEAVEEVIRAVTLGERAVEDLFDLARHHPIQILCREPAPARWPFRRCACRSARRAASTASRSSRPSTPNRYRISPMRSFGHRGSRLHDVAAFHVEHTRSAVRDDHELAAPLRLGDHRGHVGEAARAGDLAGHPDGARVDPDHEHGFGWTRRQPPVALALPQILTRVAPDGMNDPALVDSNAVIPASALRVG